MRRNKKIFVFVVFLIFALFALDFISSCKFILDKAGEVASTGPFNYKGLRFETRSIKFEEIKDRFPRIVCFGDSVTFGWNLKYEHSYPAILENFLSSKYPEVKVINSGIGGNTILDGYMRLDSDVFYYRPHLVIINFGLNDGMLVEISGNNFEANKSLLYSWDGNYYGAQLALDDFDAYYNKIIDEVKSKHIKIIVLGINPVLELYPLSKDEKFREKQREIYKLYNQKILEIARSNDIVCINLWRFFDEEGKINSYIQKDGIHPNENGTYLIADCIYKILNTTDIIVNLEDKESE